MFNVIKKESIVLLPMGQVMELSKYTGVQLYFPIAHNGDIVELSKAKRLECWSIKEEANRQHPPPILADGWSNALLRADGEDAFGLLVHSVAKSSIAVTLAWSKMLVRFPEGDLYLKEAFNG